MIIPLQYNIGYIYADIYIILIHISTSSAEFVRSTIVYPLIATFHILMHRTPLWALLISLFATPPPFLLLFCICVLNIWRQFTTYFTTLTYIHNKYLPEKDTHNLYLLCILVTHLTYIAITILECNN